jgi:hypothetical protein
MGWRIFLLIRIRAGKVISTNNPSIVVPTIENESNDFENPLLFR